MYIFWVYVRERLETCLLDLFIVAEFVLLKDRTFEEKMKLRLSIRLSTRGLTDLFPVEGNADIGPLSRECAPSQN